MNIFTNEFSSISTKDIILDLSTNGYIKIDNAVSAGFIDAISNDVMASGPAINKNGIGFVYLGTQIYLTHMLAISRVFYNYATSNEVLSISKGYLGNEFRLKALRYYETLGGHKMQWHTDNKTPNGFAETLGLIFIIYLTDTDMGYFQLIKGSQNLSKNFSQNDFSDHYIEANLKEDVIDFPGAKGTLLIYDSRMVHRANPFDDDTFIRKSLFIQIDADTSDSESILINSSFLTDLTPRKIEYLGIGCNSTQPSWPQTSREHLIDYINKKNPS